MLYINKCDNINKCDHINKMKDKNHVIISIDKEKAFDTIQHVFMIKISSKVCPEGAYLKIIKAM